MKTDYKNWVPFHFLVATMAGTFLALLLFVLFGFSGWLAHGTARLICAILFGLIAFALLLFTIWLAVLYHAFNYNGKQSLSGFVIKGISEYVSLPPNGLGLDVGCGSGALTIACAKRNPQGTMMGIDRWGKDYGAFSQTLCEQNAKAEGVDNVVFQKGDAVHLDFEDETFDVVTSNYVYHNVRGVSKQHLVLETLRVLKKGGAFVIHDLMSRVRYGDMAVFAEQLRAQGYECVQLIHTADGLFITKKRARLLGLSGSMLLVGKK